MNDAVSVNDESMEITPVEQAQEVAIIEPRVSAGAQLAALREARGWTIEQIANQLNLAGRQIQALESDNYAALPGMVIVRGFIRGYAKVLRVDAAPILAAITDEATVPNVLPPERSALSASFSETKLRSPNHRSIPFKAMVGGLVLIALGLLAFVGQRMGWVAGGHSTLAAKVEEKLIPVEPAESKSAAVVEAPEAPLEAIQTQAPSVNESTAPAVLPKPPAVVPASPVVTPVVKPPVVTAVAVPIDSKDALAVRVRQDSWVEIKRADDSIVVSRLMKAGSSEAFEITGPVSMVIGNAAGVDVTLRGTPVDVVAGTASNVARLNLK